DQLGNTRWPSLGAAIFDDEMLPIDVAMLAHSLPQCFDEGPGVGGAAGARHVADPPHPLGLLRTRRERPRSRAAEQRDELAPPHSITSSAMERTSPGMIRPRALAVLRLISSSNLPDCATGRSAGRAPPKILPLYT